MLGDIIERLLGDAKHCGLHDGRQARLQFDPAQLCRNSVVLGKLRHELSQRGKQSIIVQHRRPEFGHHIAHIGDQGFEQSLHLQQWRADCRQRLLRELGAQRPQYQANRGEILPDAVMQLARNRTPLSLFRGSQSMRQVAQPAGVAAQRRFFPLEFGHIAHRIGMRNHIALLVLHR